MRKSREYEFIRECGVFYILTINEDRPAGRPFGAIMEINNDLYISTADTKAVYKQIKQCQNIQIVALKPGTREWLRVDGTAAECKDRNIKQKMLEACPSLRKHYSSADADHFNIFRIRIANSEFN